MSSDDLLDAVQQLESLTDGDRARGAAMAVAGRVSVAELLRAADGAHQLARALAAVRPESAGEPGAEDHDPHDIGSLYT